ncbi:MAG TPA: hypothetical protein VFZ01_07075 [Geminicoccaceae bacterium]
MNACVLLGPQRRRPTVARALDRLGLDGEVLLISAGWQEREGERAELEAHVGRRVQDLMLHDRAERVRAEDPELAQALRDRQTALRELQAIHRIRLRHALLAHEEIRRSRAGGQIRTAGSRSALRAVRALDREHLRATRRLGERVETQLGAARRPALRRHLDEIRALVEGSAAILIAGGHVAVLLGRLRLFGAGDWLGLRPVVAWSAGAMALTDRVVLFHDHPPQGPGEPEILGPGLGLVPGVIALPDARHRLRLGDEARVGLLATRFAPARPLTLDDGALLIRRPGEALRGEDVLELDRRGRMRPLAAA